MIKHGMLESIEAIGVIPAVRVTSAADALFASEAVFSGGIPVVEITMTTPDAVSVISQSVRAHTDVIVGAGTVRDLDTARALPGCRSLFPHQHGPWIPNWSNLRVEHDIWMIPGALTPTEVMMAKRAGAAFIKVFPCSSVGGPSYIRALRGPFPEMRFIASGGVTQETAANYIRAGADALGIGHDLLPAEAVRARELGLDSRTCPPFHRHGETSAKRQIKGIEARNSKTRIPVIVNGVTFRSADASVKDHLT